MNCEICGAKKIQLLYSYACPHNHFEPRQNNKKYVYKLFTPNEIIMLKYEGAWFSGRCYETKEIAEEKNKNEWDNQMIVVPALLLGETDFVDLRMYPVVGYNCETQEFEIC